jgi:hypothetical protein
MICKGQIAEENRMFFEEKFYVLAGYKSAYYERLALLPPRNMCFCFLLLMMRMSCEV